MLDRVSDSKPSSASPLTIGDWRVDPAAHELARAGETVRIEPKVMQVLLRLAAVSGGVVTREELLESVWPGVVVGDEALTQVIIKLRRALGDNPRSPAYIETIAKRGYRLVAQVGAVASVPAVAEAATVAEPELPSRGKPRNRAWLAAVALALLGVVALVAFVVQSSRPAPIASSDVPADELTVTVVPFESLSSAPDQGYLARGISNDLVTDLSRLPGLRVIRTNAAGAPADNVRYVVTGSVQREGETLRINVHLAESQTKRQLWSQRFERPFGDLFALQDEIARGLVDVLPAKLQEAAKQQAARRYTKNLAAYDHFLRAQSQFLVRSARDNETARASYRKAIELDPAFARAYAGLAMTYALEPRLRSSPNAEATLARALELAETARQIDPDIPEVHWAIGFVHTQQRRHDAAIESLNRAIALNRSYADAYALMGGIHTYIGEPTKSIPLLRTALRLDPGGGYLYFMVLGRAYFFAGDIEQALINLREAATRNPVDIETRIFLAAALAASNNVAGAEWEVQEIRTLEPGFSLREWMQTYPLTDRQQRERLLGLLGRVGLT